MSKVTHKLQVTLPTKLAKQLKIKPGDEIGWEMTGDAVRLRPAAPKRSAKTKKPSHQLRLFDQASRRQRQREKSLDPTLIGTAKAGRGWKREQLYSRGGTDRH